LRGAEWTTASDQHRPIGQERRGMVIRDRIEGTS
jgi:hypothetical protein